MSNVYVKRYACTINSYMFHNYFVILKKNQFYQETPNLLNSENDYKLDIFFKFLLFRL